MERGGSVRDRPQQGTIFRTVVHAGRAATADEKNSLGPVSDRARPGMERGGSVRDRPQQGTIFRTVGLTIGLAVALAAALWTQAGLALWLAVLVLGYILALKDLRPTPVGRGQGQPFGAALFGWLGGLTLGALGLLPLLLRRGLGSGDWPTFADHLVYPHQLLLAGWGNGPSIPGPDDTLTFQLGLVACGLAVLGIVLGQRQALVTLSPFDKLTCACGPGAGRAGFCHPVVVLILAFLSTTLAAPLWKLAPFLARTLTYPWQLLLLAGPWLAWLAGLGGRALQSRYVPDTSAGRGPSTALPGLVRPGRGRTGATAGEKQPGLEALAGLLIGGRNRLKPLVRSRRGIFRTVPLFASLIALALLGSYGDLQPPTSAVPVADAPVAVFGNNEIILLSATPAGAPGPGGQITVLARWQALRPLAQDYTVFFHVATPDGAVWGQQDIMPQGGQLPTSQWRPGQVVADQYQVRLRPDAPVGADYRYLLGLYQWQTGQRLRAGTDDKVVVTP
jgi:hypothetical protein